MFTDDDSAALFPRRGQPAEAPWRLALVLVMQYVEDLSDRQAADAVRSRIDWKYALSLELTDPGFDSTVLSEFRTRLVMGAAEQRLLDAILTKSSSTRGSQLGGGVPTRRMYWRMSAPSTAWSVLGKPSAMRSTIWPRSPRSGSRAIVSWGARRRLDDTRLPTSQEDRHVRPGNRRGRLRPLDRTLCPQALAGYVKSPPSRRYDGCGCSNSIERMAACAGAQSTKGSRPLGFLSVPL